ncbi:enoyl-CoA-hydratase DpgB [Actinomadura sp. CNU-125]|uniref:enoyl-CoA-hydratase DpgB n=1 Tax=Actinomadura sp. CNU-125 TaxID=1904961 RepID=UPI0021CCA25A|nr:enoyl-CoA-hydratase DpgB [Actinomadura sp. CNU-125]
MTQATGTARAAVRIDGAAPLSAAAVRELSGLCDLVEGPGGPGLVVLETGGAPGPSRDGLTTSLVTKWERTLRRLERLPAVTVAVAAGDVGGPALVALLVADVRIAAPDAPLVAGTGGAATWPGMALFRMAHQSGAAAVRRTVLFGARSARRRRSRRAWSTSWPPTRTRRWRRRRPGSAGSPGRSWRSAGN